jgi:hypothetical protein
MPDPDKPTDWDSKGNKDDKDDKDDKGNKANKAGKASDTASGSGDTAKRAKRLIYNWSLCSCGEYNPGVDGLMSMLSKGYTVSQQPPPCCSARYSSKVDYPEEQTDKGMQTDTDDKGMQTDKGSMPDKGEQQLDKGGVQLDKGGVQLDKGEHTDKGEQTGEQTDEVDKGEPTDKDSMPDMKGDKASGSGDNAKKLIYNWSLCVCGGYEVDVTWLDFMMSQGYTMTDQPPPCCSAEYSSDGGYPEEQTGKGMQTDNGDKGMQTEKGEQTHKDSKADKGDDDGTDF